MRLNMWTEIRTAAEVARLGRISAAAGTLGMHHSSVIRHIDSLEASLGTKLFQRSARGYTPTEAGNELLRTASEVSDQLGQMLNRIETSRDQVSGHLMLTAVPGLENVLLPMLQRYHLRHPQVQISYSADQRTFEMSRGEAHVALRAGAKPNQPDYVVSHVFDWTHTLYASRGYIAQYGRPETPADLTRHHLIGGEDHYGSAGFNRWLDSLAPEESFALRSPQSGIAYQAIGAGLGIGFLPRATCGTDVVELFPAMSDEEWKAPVWMVTHTDLHRSSKVQSLTRFIQEEAKQWRLSDKAPAG